MPAPTIASRLARKAVLFSGDAALRAALAAKLPEGWSLTPARAVGDVGGFQDLLLHRFVLVDLDAGGGEEIVREIRSGMMLNVPLFCFGGAEAARDAARAARADRVLARAELEELLPQLCEQFGW